MPAHVYLYKQPPVASDNFTELFVFLSMCDRTAISHSARNADVGTAHNCGKLKGNRRQIDDLDYASAKYRSRRYLINVYATFFVAVQKKICVLS